MEQCLAAGLRLTTPEEVEVIQQTAERRTADIPPEDLAILGYGEWLAGLRRGIAAHHAGMLPAFKEVVEELFSAGLVRAVFATETLALGINMPARTVVIEKLDKWNGETHANLTAGEYTQLTGRAGRRGIDVEGHAVVLWQPGMDPGAVAGLASTRTYPLNSSFRPSYNMAVNLTGWAGRARASALLESSFAQFQADRGVVGLARQVRRNRQAMDELAAAMTCDKGDFAQYAALRRTLSHAEGELARTRSASRRAEAARSLSQLRPGDIIRVPGGRQAGVAVVLMPGAPAGGGADHGARNGRGAHSGPGPLVLTAAHQVKRLSTADFPVPAEVIDKIRIPGSFSPRSPQHRKDLAATVRNRLAGRELGAPARASDWERGAPDGTAHEVTELRKQMRRHPCHDCPDREAHARYADRYLRLQRETDALEQRVAGRSHVIARTFDRVCAVLDRLGYLSGDTVTADGKRLAGLYSELDLLAAECLRRGLWDGLSPAELAACVSSLTFTSRQADDVQPPRLPKGRVPEALNAMARTWAELDQLEKDHGLSFLREPDLGFAWAAYRWANGTKLESVLAESPDLTPGDFVRAVKQLIDLLDQIAAACRIGRRWPVPPRPPVPPSTRCAAAWSPTPPSLRACNLHRIFMECDCALADIAVRTGSCTASAHRETARRPAMAEWPGLLECCSGAPGCSSSANRSSCSAGSPRRRRRQPAPRARHRERRVRTQPGTSRASPASRTRSARTRRSGTRSATASWRTRSTRRPIPPTRSACSTR